MALEVKNAPVNAGDIRDAGSVPGLGRKDLLPGKGNCTPFQYSCLGNLTDTGAWRATVLGFTKSRM